MPESLRILLIEDNAGEAELLGAMLKEAPGGPYLVEVAVRSDEARGVLLNRAVDVVLLDLGLPDSQGLDTLDRIVEVAPHTPVVVLTELDDESLALAALDHGAQDYAVKGLLNTRGLFRAISHATQRKSTERRLRAVEAQLLQAQKMEALGRLAGSVAHDFNNLLTVILGSCDLLASDDAAIRRSAVGEIRDASSRAAALTARLLAFSRKRGIDLQVLDLGECYFEIQDMLERMVGANTRLESTIEPGGIPVQADWSQLQQVFLNLVVNARDAMPSGGCIEVEIGQDPAGQARITVRDSGVGMTEEERERCFEPFYTTKEEGTGIGLATVYGIVQQFGGTIQVESEPGRGTRFHVLLPLWTEPLPSQEEVERVARDVCLSCPGFAVVVEDQDSIRHLLTRLLERRGFRVVSFGTAEEAWETLQHERPDLLVTDIVLPGMWGNELAARVRELHPSVPVVQTSGFMPAPGDGDPRSLFLPKPFTEQELLEKVCAARKLQGECPDPEKGRE